MTSPVCRANALLQKERFPSRGKQKAPAEDSAGAFLFLLQ